MGPIEDNLTMEQTTVVVHGGVALEPMQEKVVETQDDIDRRNGKLVFPKHKFTDFSSISPVAWTVCLGDACHNVNVTDGVMIGAALLSCNSTMGWVICGAMLART